jgi:hypothetical protein
MVDYQKFRQHSLLAISQARIRMTQEQKEVLLDWKSRRQAFVADPAAVLVHAGCRAQLSTTRTGGCIRSARLFAVRRKNFDADFRQQIDRALIHGDAPVQGRIRDSKRQRLHKPADRYQ